MKHMTYHKALQIIRAQTREGDGLAETFKIIYRNRDSHPVRDWAIWDLQLENKIDYEIAKRLYNRHLKRLFEIFVTR